MIIQSHENHAMIPYFHTTGRFVMSGSGNSVVRAYQRVRMERSESGGALGSSIDDNPNNPNKSGDTPARPSPQPAAGGSHTTLYSRSRGAK